MFIYKICKKYDFFFSVQDILEFFFKNSINWFEIFIFFISYIYLPIIIASKKCVELSYIQHPLILKNTKIKYKPRLTNEWQHI